MKLAVMQPYFYPYIGYYQLMHSVDLIVLYDDVQFTKKGWINRNRILHMGRERLLTLPIKQAPHTNTVRERIIADLSLNARKQMVRILQNAYCKSSCLEEVLPTLEKGIVQHEMNLFKYLYNGLVTTLDMLGVSVRLLRSSQLDIDPSLKKQDKVLSVCKACEADEYVNLPGGRSLYTYQKFASEGIKLHFLDPRSIKYEQFDSTFVPNLSIIDVLLCNGVEQSRLLLEQYDMNAA